MTTPPALSPLARVLYQLLEGGRIPASQVSRAVIVELRPLLDSGAVNLVRAGAGYTYSVAHRQAVKSFADSRFPVGLMQGAAGADLSDRERGVMEVRDSKRTRGVGFEYALVRLAPGLELLRTDGPVPWHATLPEGAPSAWAVAVVLEEESAGDWRLSDPDAHIAVVENLDTFSRVDLADIGVTAALFAGGRLSSRQIALLTSLAAAGHGILHVGDYDPVGLEEYLRLKELVREVSLYVPEDLEALFKLHSTPAILQKPRNRSALARLRTVTDPAVRRVVGLIDAENGCLEQEAITVAHRASMDT
ncbi:MAG: hypothetical protein CVV05_00285 [Gammaproteobacteria bacterium HGW-Gammaproteobacteria-1]|jgi:hypothetical protein|nr:MAG: hypothetical protein CVV05_00285 [Gammaproteobacteria bacterium HGW-Gammaproteobacteria-1]